MISNKKSAQIIDDIKIHNLKCSIEKSPNHDKVSCNCTHIKSVDLIKYLGVTFDKYLKRDTHIDITVKTIRSLFYKFKSLNNILLPITM